MVSESRRIAISDIHGCGDTFEKLLEETIGIAPSDTIYLLGDFIDRGPTSKKVIDLILFYQANGYSFYCLMGNHEDMFLKGIDNPYYHELWASVNGGIDTLDSFGIHHAGEMPEVYMNFFKNLRYFFSLPDLLLVHAGFNFNAPDPFQDYESMVWIRNFPIDLNQTGGRKIIHGHTPIPFTRIKESIQNNHSHINIDNGCAYPKEGLQGLIALNLDTFELWRQPNIERFA